MRGIKWRRKDPLDVIWPSHVRLFPDYAELGDQFARSYIVVGYPREVSPGWFEPLIGFPNPLTIAFVSGPMDSQEAQSSMSRRMIWHRGVQAADQAQGLMGRAERIVALEDAERVRLDLAKGEIRMIEVGLTITLWASSPEALDTSTRLFESLVQSMMIAVRRLRYQQKAGIRQALPLGELPPKVREIDSQTWATLFPFSTRDVVHDGGQVLGINPVSRGFIIADRFQLASPHSITIGWSGAGKSFAAKLETLRSRYRGWAVSVVDPEGEYISLGKVGAMVWKLGVQEDGEAGFPYDPFDLGADHDLEEENRKTEFLLRWLSRLAPELMSEFGSVVHDAVWRSLRYRHQHFSPGTNSSLNAHALMEEIARDSVRASDRLDLAHRRWQSSMGNVRRGAPETFEVFDLHRLGESTKGAAYLALTEWLMRRMGQERGRRLIVFDEAWHLLNDQESSPYLEELFRRGRKWDTAVSLLSQDIGDFTRHRAAEVCLRNAPMVLLLRQHPQSLAEVSQLLRLHEGEVDIIEAAGIGEGLLLLADDHLPIRVMASKYEQQLLMSRQPGGEAV